MNFPLKTIAFHSDVTEDSVDDCRDIDFSKWGVINFSFHIAFTIRIVMRISCMSTLCTGWIGTSIFLLHGSPCGSWHLFLEKAHGSFYTACWLGGNWCRQANTNVLISDPFLRLWYILCLLPKKTNFTGVLMGWIHLAYSQLKAHIKSAHENSSEIFWEAS